MSTQKAPRIPLPKSWSKHVRSAMLHVISLAQYVAVYTRSWAADTIGSKGRIGEHHRQMKVMSDTGYTDNCDVAAVTKSTAPRSCRRISTNNPPKNTSEPQDGL